MDQRNERFVPHVLAVMVGTMVDFPNSDRTYHNVFSLSRAQRFDLDLMRIEHPRCAFEPGNFVFEKQRFNTTCERTYHRIFAF